MEIVPGIHRLGNGEANSYLIEESGEVTIVDAGMPGYFGQLSSVLRSIGLDLSSVRALILTHAHSDHIGYAERLRRENAVPVWIEELDAPLARGEVAAIRDKNVKSRWHLGPALEFLWYGVRYGALRTPHLTEVSTFGDGATLDMPGSPRVILVPGHTSGSAAIHVASRNALFVGDAFATKNVLTGAEGPQLAPFGADLRVAMESLRCLSGVDARYVLPGHGQVWTGGVAAAIDEVRKGGVALKA